MLQSFVFGVDFIGIVICDIEDDVQMYKVF